MRIVRPLLTVLLLASLGFGIWWYFFPSPERAIKKRLTKLSELISADVAGSNIKRVANVNRIVGYFSDDVVIRADAISRYNEIVTGRDSIMQGMMATRSGLERVEAKFYNLDVKVDDSKTNAIVLLTALVRINNQEDPFMGDAKLKLRKEEQKWLITSVEPVKSPL